MMFRIGDKVKVIYNSNGSGIMKRAMNKIGIIKSIHDSENVGTVYIEFGEKIFGDLTTVGFFKNEIEKVSVKGEQLLFSFMIQ